MGYTSSSPPDRPRGRPQRQAASHHDALGGGIRIRVADCPCGCRTRLPWVDDPGCIRHRPLRIIAWPAYDVEVLGLVPHDRATCPRCRAVAS